MNTTDLADAASLPDYLDRVVDVIESLVESSGWRGISPARAARLAGCTTEEARLVIAHLVGHQRAHTTGTWKHVYRKTT